MGRPAKRESTTASCSDSPESPAPKQMRRSKVKEEAWALSEATGGVWKQLLEELREELSGSCLETLRRSLPFVLDSEAKGELCSFERYLLDTVSTSAKASLSKRERRLVECQQHLKEHQAKQEEAKKSLGVAEEAATSALQQKEGAGARKVKAEDWETEVIGNFMEVTSALQLLDKDMAAAQKEREDFETQVEALLPPLKEGSFDRKDWRNRNSAITRLLALFPADTPRSLSEALHVAFKTDPAHRHGVTTKAIEEGEQSLDKRSLALASAVEEAQSKLASMQAAAESAQADLALAEKQCDEAAKEVALEESRWKQAEATAEEARSFMASMPEEETSILATLTEAREALEKLQTAMGAFDSRTPTPAPAPAPAPVPAPTTARPSPPPNVLAATVTATAIQQAAEMTPIKKTRREVDLNSEEAGSSSDVSTSSSMSCEKISRTTAAKSLAAGKVADITMTAKLAGSEDVDAKVRHYAPSLGC